MLVSNITVNFRLSLATRKLANPITRNVGKSTILTCSIFNCVVDQCLYNAISETMSFTSNARWTAFRPNEIFPSIENPVIHISRTFRENRNVARPHRHAKAFTEKCILRLREKIINLIKTIIIFLAIPTRRW